MELAEVIGYAKSFGLPVLGAVAGFVTTSYGVRTRVKNLEKTLGILKRAWRMDFDTFKTNQVDRQRELKAALEQKYEELKEKLEEIEENLHAWQRDSSASFASDDELNRFIEEQQRQWQAIQRTLGQIEGMLKKLP